MVGSGTPAPDKAYIDDSSTAVDAPGGGVSPAAEVNDRMKRRQSRRSSTEDEPPVERLGCNETHHKAVLVLRQIRDHTAFTLFFILAILYSGVIVGVGLYDEITSRSGMQAYMDASDIVVGVLFTIEVSVKILAEGNQPLEFFRSSWNVFDFLVVVLQFLPVDSSAITTVRLIRVLRVLRLVRALPKLRVLVSGLAQALSSIGYIGLLLGLLYYFFSVLSVSLYAKNDPVGMGTLHVAFVTLFQAGTLEDWTDIMYTQSEGCEVYGYQTRRDQCVWSDPQPFLSSLFFVVFTVLANLLVLNLFIGVILITMMEAQAALEEELRAEAQQKQQQLADLKAGRKGGRREAQRRRRTSGDADADTDARIDLAQRERLSAISQHLVTAITGLNDMYAVHADLEATRTVWHWVSHAPAASTAGNNLRLLRELRQAQLVRALCEDGDVSQRDLHWDSDDEGGFAASAEGASSAAGALKGIKTRLNVVSAFQGAAASGAPSVHQKGVQGPSSRPLAASARLALTASRASAGGGAVSSVSRADSSDQGGIGQPTPPTTRSNPPLQLGTINESVGSEGGGTGAPGSVGGASNNDRPASPGTQNTRASLSTESDAPRSALGDGGAAFDMDIGRAAIRSLIKPVWFASLANASGRRRSGIGRAAVGGVRSISRVLSGTALSGVLSGRSGEFGSDSGGEGVGASRSKFSYMSGDSTTAEALESSGQSTEQGGLISKVTPPTATQRKLAARRASAPPMRAEVEHSPELQPEHIGGDSKLVPPRTGAVSRPGPPSRPTPPPSRARGGVRKVATTPDESCNILDDAPTAASPEAAAQTNPLAYAVQGGLGGMGGGVSPAMEPSSRERSVVAARRFSTLVTAMSGVRQLQKSFRQRAAAAAAVAASELGGVFAASAGPATLQTDSVGGLSTSTGGVQSHSPPPGSSPAADGARLSPFGESPHAHGPIRAGPAVSPAGESRPPAADSKGGAFKRLALASTKVFGGGSKASSAGGGVGGSRGVAISPGAGRAYVMQSDRPEVVAARAAVAAAIDSMSPAFQQLGAGLDSVARVLLKYQEHGGGRSSSRSKLARARTKLGVLHQMHSSRKLTAERGDSVLSAGSDNSTSTPVSAKLGTGGLDPPLAGVQGGHRTLSLGGGAVSDQDSVGNNGSGIYAAHDRTMSNPSSPPTGDSKGGAPRGAAGIGFSRALPTVRSAAAIGASRGGDHGDGAVIAGRPPLQHGTDAAGAPGGQRFKRLSQSMATAGARSRLLASAGMGAGGRALSPDGMGSGESALPPPTHFMGGGFPTGAGSAGNLSYDRASAEASWGPSEKGTGSGLESGRNNTDGNSSTNSAGVRARPALQLAAPGGAVFGGNARGGARMGSGPPGGHMGPLSPTTVNAARMATLMGALDKLDASAAALADGEED